MADWIETLPEAARDYIAGRRVDEALDDLRALCAGTDAEAIDAGIKALEKRCEFYVERRMNANIRKAMAGHSVNEFEQESE